MNYEENAMAAAYRCVIFTTAGDGDVSEEEIESATRASEGTEQWYEFSTSFKRGFMKAMDGLFGIDSEDEEEEEEEEKLDLVPLTEAEIKGIATEVLAKLAKCDGAADVKAYAHICASSVDEYLYGHIISTAFGICGSDSPEWVPDRNETRNIKYLCAAFGEKYKEYEKSYLDSLTWYHDDLLGDDLKVENVDKKFETIEANSADAVLSVGMMAAIADGDFGITWQSLCEHWFLAQCDIARVKGESVIEVPETMGDYIFALYDETFAALFAKTGNPGDVKPDPDLEFDEPAYNESLAIREKIIKNHPVVLPSVLESITDESIYRLTFKNATFLCGADSDNLVVQMDIMGGRIDINHEEETALEAIGKHLGFDEDQLYGLKKRIEEGQLGSLYSSD